MNSLRPRRHRTHDQNQAGGRDATCHRAHGVASAVLPTAVPIADAPAAPAQTGPRFWHHPAGQILPGTVVVVVAGVVVVGVVVVVLGVVLVVGVVDDRVVVEAELDAVEDELVTGAAPPNS